MFSHRTQTRPRSAFGSPLLPSCSDELALIAEYRIGEAEFAAVRRRHTFPRLRR